MWLMVDDKGYYLLSEKLSVPPMNGQVLKSFMTILCFVQQLKSNGICCQFGAIYHSDLFHDPPRHKISDTSKQIGFCYFKQRN